MRHLKHSKLTNKIQLHCLTNNKQHLHNNLIRNKLAQHKIRYLLY